MSASGERNLRQTILVIVGLVMVLALLFILVRGCVEKRRENERQRSTATSETTGDPQLGGGRGPQDGTGTGTSGTGAQQDNSATQGSDSGSQTGETREGQLAPPQEPPEQVDDGGISPVEESSGSMAILDQRVTPYRSSPGQAMAFGATIRGDAVRVSMNVVDTTGGGGAFTVELTPGPAIDGTTNWSYQGVSPSFPGTYSYSTTAVAAGGCSVSSAGSTIIVE